MQNKERWRLAVRGVIVIVLSLVIAKQIYLSERLGDLSREYIPDEFWMGWFNLFGAVTAEEQDRVGGFVLFFFALIVVTLLWLVVGGCVRRFRSSLK